MTPAYKKSLIAEYKQRPTIAGVFAVICIATGRTWVGTSRHIDTQQNGLWFTLRLGSSPHRSLQKAWNDHGEEMFRYEQLDRLPPDTSQLRLMDELDDRAGRWRARLRAEAL